MGSKSPGGTRRSSIGFAQPVCFVDQSGFKLPGWEKLLLGKIPLEIQPVIYGYWRGGASLKDSYRLQLKFTVRANAALSPHAVAVDNYGFLYVGDFSRDEIQVFNYAGAMVRAIPSRRPPGSFAPSTGTPTYGGFVFDFEGNLVLTNGETHSVEVYDTRRGILKLKFGIAGSGEGQLSCPAGLAIDNSGNIIVADFDNNRLQIFSPKGEWIKCFGSAGSGEGQVDGPSGVAVDPTTANIIVAETRTHRIQIFDPSGKSIRMIGSTQGWEPGKFSFPTGVAVDRAGNIVVADNMNGRIQIFSREGKFLMKKELERGEGKMCSAKTVFIDREANLIVTDGQNGGVQIFA